MPAGGADPAAAAAADDDLCDNTVGGRTHVADDRGRVCAREALDRATGCCAATAPRHACDACGAADGCCASYEHCVSCCLAPAARAAERLRSEPRGLGKPETGLWATPFELCRAACRTSSRSTAHENAFIAERRFCFSEAGRPRVGGAAPPLPAGIEAAPGVPGESCAAVCAARGRACVPAALAALNDCDELRAAFACEAGCAVAPKGAAALEFPGYVGNGAGKEAWPALCATLPPAPAERHDGEAEGEAAAPAFDCDASAKDVRRLCACGPAPAVAAVEEEEASGGAAEGGGGGAAAGGDEMRPRS
jgi:hypothetical protein